ncbi:MAG: response regulator transcription factor [Opitutae bacterium]|jgi:DNA-binding NarL/FixJ family response regulator|nr:response regulator transcription factor [Opitutae bacterium]
MNVAKKTVEADHCYRILVIEDHPLMREAISRWINSDPDLKVCGQADNSAAGMKAVVQFKPDLVLSDISLEGRSGLELLKDLKAMNPDLPVIMHSMHNESVYAMRAMRAGARGYVMKDAGGAEVVSAIKEVLAGGSAFSRVVNNQVLDELAGRARGHQSPIAVLTDREFEILELYGHGKTSGEIAQQLNVSPKTVGAHRYNICCKLELHSTSELICYAAKSVSHDGDV